MSTTSLTRKYRPQRFAEVAGQDAVKRILSRAAGEDRVAPAYLFSGTRGVGKTTLARIFAKALNCETAPAVEPCNVCAQCRQITSGVSPDVIEIDAATHGGVDEARRLKEDVGYAPLQSRYKVFIIDEAHMLSKAAFNALLKTLEEPPGRVTFVLATTEPHKFPATIISRCQHFIFKRMTQAELEGHLVHILSQENLDYERGAVNLIAKRGAGSVRDSMSLLGQALALGEERLTEADVRGVLGLAGQEVFFGLASGVHGQDCAAVSNILRQILDRGLDIGFFLRELAGVWRNMFLLRQTGENGFSLVDLSHEEASEWLAWAKKFDLAHIHACWQMTLEGQRRVMTSLEPALALELLLMNLAYLPQLLSLDNPVPAASGGRPSGPSHGRAPAPAGTTRPGAPKRSWSPPAESRSAQAASVQGGAPGAAPASGFRPGGYVPPVKPSAAPPAPPPRLSPSSRTAPPPAPPSAPVPPPAQAPGARLDMPPGMSTTSGATETETGPAPPAAPPIAPPAAPAPDSPESGRESFAARGPRTWEGFVAYYEDRRKNGFPPLSRLENASGEILESEGVLAIACVSGFQRDQLLAQETFNNLAGLATEYFGPGLDIRLAAANGGAKKDKNEIKSYVNERPEVKQAVAEFGAEVLDYRPRLHDADTEE